MEIKTIFYDEFGNMIFDKNICIYEIKVIELCDELYVLEFDVISLIEKLLC